MKTERKAVVLKNPMPTNIQNYKLCTDAIKLKNHIESDFMVLAESLYKIKTQELYKPSWSSWDEYREELKMSENSVNKLIQIHSKLVVEYKIDDQKIVSAGGPSVLADLLPILNNKEEAEDWLEKASVLTRKDLRDEITESKTGISMRDCKHINTITIVVCRDCHLKMEDH